MKLQRIIPFLVSTLLLAACASGTTTTPGVTENPTVPPTQSSSPTQTSAPTLSSASTSYPAPSSVATVPASSAYPAPGQSNSGSAGIPLSGYEPQAGDDSLKRGEATVDMTNSQLIVTATEPAQAKVVLNGTMPDPCHSLRVVVTPPDTTNTINIDAYSLFDPNTACVTKIETFSATIPLGSYTSGDYNVNVNGGKLGMFQTVFSPQPDDEKLDRGDATVDMKTSRVAISSTTAGNVSADLKGYMADPCHQLRIVMTPADSERNIKLDVYSVYNSKNACITVIQPFEVIFPLGSFTSGHYSVYVNGELLGEFDL